MLLYNTNVLSYYIKIGVYLSGILTRDCILCNMLCLLIIKMENVWRTKFCTWHVLGFNWNESLVFISTTLIKTHHINCHVIMYKFSVHNFVHLALLSQETWAEYIAELGLQSSNSTTNVIQPQGGSIPFLEQPQMSSAILWWN